MKARGSSLESSAAPSSASSRPVAVDGKLMDGVTIFSKLPPDARNEVFGNFGGKRTKRNRKKRRTNKKNRTSKRR